MGKIMTEGEMDEDRTRRAEITFEPADENYPAHVMLALDDGFGDAMWVGFPSPEAVEEFITSLRVVAKGNF